MPEDLLCPKCGAANPVETLFCGKCGSKLAETEGAADEPDPLLGAFVGDRFLVHQKLGEGGMGVVYRAEQTAIGRRVALKVLHAHLTKDDSLHARFQNEAASCSRLTHPNTVTIYDFGKTDQGSLYIAMEYIDGKSLDDEIREKVAIPWMRACHIAIQICGSLSDAHRQSIVHRDLKPENIMLCERGGEPDFVKVLDFGIAKILGEDGTDQRQALTKTGMVFGTPQYMSPEQIRGEIVDHRTDIYSIGVILYEMLTGNLPFTSERPMGVLSKHLFDIPPSITKTNPSAFVPEALESLVMSALAKEADQRPTSMLELKKGLAGIADLSQENTLVTAADEAAAETVKGVKVSGGAGGSRGAIPSTLMQTSSDIEPSFQRKTGLIVGVLVVALLILGGGVGFWIYSGHQSRGAQVSTLAAGAGEAQNAGNAKFPTPKPIGQALVDTAGDPEKKKPVSPGASGGIKSTGGTPVKKRKDVPCTFTGGTDAVGAAVRSHLRQKESSLARCARNNSGGTTAFRFALPPGSSRPKKIRLMTSSIMDDCLRPLLVGGFSEKVEKARKGKASFTLERRGGVLRKCEVVVNTQLNQSIGPIVRPPDVKVPQKPGKTDKKDKDKNKKNDLPLTITRED